MFYPSLWSAHPLFSNGTILSFRIARWFFRSHDRVSTWFIHSSYKVIQCRRKNIHGDYFLKGNKRKIQFFVLTIYLIYFIALSMLHKAGEKITKVLGELWSANSIIMWVNCFWLPITKPKKINKTKKKENACSRNILCRLFSQ